jgi:uncharacterized CHY-type Zn-finger protein
MQCKEYWQRRDVCTLQVSRCEKFGYGYMMSQLATTACGMSALQQTGRLTVDISDALETMSV